MRLGRFTLVFVCLLALVSVPARAEEGWHQLFNGKDMTGWHHVGRGDFTVENGALRSSGGMGLLWYGRETVGNAVVRVVYKGNTPSANAGVFIRIPEQPQDAWFPVHRGYEVQIQDTADEFHRTGSIYSMARADEFPPSKDGWNTMEIKLEGRQTIVSVNGKVVDSFDAGQPVPARTKYYEPQRGPRPDYGYIGLQNHDEKSIVWFKEISVKPLSE
jgi:3-keto-disaccharide hydrolase